MSADQVETAVTGKPMDHYEPYVELVTHVLANGLALAHDREFVRSLDLTLPIHEAVRDAARDSIKWRFAFEIDRIEETRAESAKARVGVTATEPSDEQVHDALAARYPRSVARTRDEWGYEVFEEMRAELRAGGEGR